MKKINHTNKWERERLNVFRKMEYKYYHSKDDDCINIISISMSVFLFIVGVGCIINYFL